MAQNKKKGLNCALPVALGTHSQRAGGSCSKLVGVETPLSMPLALLLALTLLVFAANGKMAG